MTWVHAGIFAAPISPEVHLLILLWRQDVIPCFQRVQKFGLTLPILFHRPQAASCENKHVIAACDCIHAHLSSLFSVHVCVVQVTWLRSVVFDRLVNGQFAVVADRVGSILRRVVIDRGCSC